MSYAPPTVSDFKGYFDRDFPYSVPSYGAVGRAVVTAGVVTAITVEAGGVLYTSAPTVTIVPVDENGSGATATATVTNGSVSGFTVTAGGSGYTTAPEVEITGGSGDESDTAKIRDKDIRKALFEAAQNFNRGLFGTDESADVAFLYLAAHYLCMDIASAQEGLASKYNWLTTGKSVGSVSASFGIPDRILRNPALAYYSTTKYGAKYLSIIAPLLVGNVTVLPARSLP